MNLFTVPGIAIIGAVLALVIKNKNPDSAIVLTMAAAAIILLLTAGSISPIIDKVNSFTSIGSYNYIGIPIKALGITLLARFVSSMCEDAGDKVLSFSVMLFARISVIVLALPLFDELLGILQEIMKMV